MPAAAKFSETSLTEKRFLLTGELTKDGGSALLLAGQVSDLTLTHEHPPGTVLAYYTAGVGYVRADSASADHETPASVHALIDNPGAGGWDGNVTISSSEFDDLVVALSGANSDAAVATAINNAAAALNPESQAPLVASDDGKVKIATVKKGKGVWIKAVHATVAAMFGASGATGNGTSPKIRVTRQTAWLKDDTGTGQDFLVDTIQAGDFDTSELSGLTAEARAVLEKNGSQFD